MATTTTTILTALLASSTTSYTSLPNSNPAVTRQTVTIVSRLCGDFFIDCASSTYLTGLYSTLFLNDTASSQLLLSSAQNVDIDLVKCQTTLTGGGVGPILTVADPLSSSFGTTSFESIECTIGDSSKAPPQTGGNSFTNSTSNQPTGSESEGNVQAVQIVPGSTAVTATPTSITTRHVGTDLDSTRTTSLPVISGCFTCNGEGPDTSLVTAISAAASTGLSDATAVTVMDNGTYVSPTPTENAPAQQTVNAAGRVGSVKACAVFVALTGGLIWSL